MNQTMTMTATGIASQLMKIKQNQGVQTLFSSNNLQGLMNAHPSANCAYQGYFIARLDDTTLYHIPDPSLTDSTAIKLMQHTRTNAVSMQDLQVNTTLGGTIEEKFEFKIRYIMKSTTYMLTDLITVKVGCY